MLPAETPQQTSAVTELIFFPFSEGCVLFRPGTRKLWTLNHIAAVIWSLAVDVDITNAHDISARLVSMYGVSPDLAKSDTESVLRSLRAEGLLGVEPSECDAAEIKSVSLGDVEYPPIRVPNGTERYYFNTLGHLIEFCSTDQSVASEYVSALQVFAVAQADRAPDITLLIVSSSNVGGKPRHDVYINGRCYSKELPEGDIVPALLGVTFTSIAESLKDHLLFHAAVLEKDSRAFLFPGAAGSGKTTLAASLACRGYQFFGDELALLDPGNGLIAPLPLPMSIKAGAFSLLSPLYPELDHLPIYRRADGKEVKILPPVFNRALNLAERVKPAAIIFPQYDSTVPSQIVPLGKTVTISRLVSLCSSSRPLHEQDILAMIRLVDDTPCYGAVYAEADTVYDLIEDIGGKL